MHAPDSTHKFLMYSQDHMRGYLLQSTESDSVSSLSFLRICVHSQPCVVNAGCYGTLCKWHSDDVVSQECVTIFSRPEIILVSLCSVAAPTI